MGLGPLDTLCMAAGEPAVSLSSVRPVRVFVIRIRAAGQND
jgi:hypothetical protein